MAEHDLYLPDGFSCDAALKDRIIDNAFLANALKYSYARTSWWRAWLDLEPILSEFYPGDRLAGKVDALARDRYDRFGDQTYFDVAEELRGLELHEHVRDLGAFRGRELSAVPALPFASPAGSYSERAYAAAGPPAPLPTTPSAPESAPEPSATGATRGPSSIATSEITMESTQHSRMRCDERGISRLQMQRALKHGKRSPGLEHEGRPTWKFEHQGIRVVADASHRNRTAITAVRLEARAGPAPRHTQPQFNSECSRCGGMGHPGCCRCAAISRGNAFTARPSVADCYICEACLPLVSS